MKKISDTLRQMLPADDPHDARSALGLTHETDVKQILESHLGVKIDHTPTDEGDVTVIPDCISHIKCGIDGVADVGGKSTLIEFKVRTVRMSGPGDADFTGKFVGSVLYNLRRKDGTSNAHKVPVYEMNALQLRPHHLVQVTVAMGVMGLEQACVAELADVGRPHMRLHKYMVPFDKELFDYIKVQSAGCVAMIKRKIGPTTSLCESSSSELK